MPTRKSSTRIPILRRTGFFLNMDLGYEADDDEAADAIGIRWRSAERGKAPAALHSSSVDGIIDSEEARYRRGVPVKPTEKTSDVAIDKQGGAKGRLCQDGRGDTVRYLAEIQADGPEQIKGLSIRGYHFDSMRSTNTEYVFIRTEILGRRRQSDAGSVIKTIWNSAVAEKGDVP